jgi:hypothetical protein
MNQPDALHLQAHRLGMFGIIPNGCLRSRFKAQYMFIKKDAVPY